MRPRGPRRTQVVEEPLDPPLADLGDLPPAQLGRDALGVPVRVQAHRDHDLLQPGRVLEQRVAWTVWLGHQGAEAAPLVRRLPAEQAATAAAAQRQGRDEALLAHDPDQPRTLTHQVQVAAARIRARRPTAAGRQKAEARTLLERVPQPAAVGIATLLEIAIQLIHAAQVAANRSRVPETTGNFN